MDARRKAGDAMLAIMSAPAVINGDVPLSDRVPLSPDLPRHDVEQLCLERGLRMTPQRHAIVRVLSEADDHPSVEQVYQRALAYNQQICLATVYRTIRIFEQKGILQSRDFGTGRARYEPLDHEHHHLVDVDTGDVVEFSIAAHEHLLRAIAEDLGFQVVSLRLEIFGKRYGFQRNSAGEADGL
ncbi:Fur family transcriptional regulator [Paracraurococcus lichenis]|uniref:Fur family transcriptional regulator n=1 Tax=Paracraurococcus lichenis TaxID=3064888 RepID=A0ABT9E8J2_9PROT|nr:Fur family transcriptional regulator [Paracraurococcus sp. LOR1-02]MDO9712517.1 Fur family transcriptional regulator [Paracraurococcus sp. LOR1-02]